MPLDILQMLIVLVILFLLVRPVGTYMAAVFTRKPSAVDRVFDPIDNGIYRLSGVNPNENQRWPAYVKAMLITNFAMWAILFIILEVQQLLPLNPDGQGPVNPWLAFNTSLSFITNTNWQNYGGEKHAVLLQPDVRHHLSPVHVRGDGSSVRHRLHSRSGRQRRAG